MQIEELLPFYAIDALTDEEREFVEAELAANPALYDVLAEYQEGAEALALTVAPLEPSAELFSGLMARVEAAPRTQPQSAPQPIAARPPIAKPAANQRSLGDWWRDFWASWSQPVAAAGFAMAALAVVWAFTLLGQLDSTQTQLAQLETNVLTIEAQNAELVAINTQLQAEIDKSNQLIAFASEPLTQRFSISGTEAQAAATGQFLVNPADESALLTVAGLQPLSAELTYQFWLIGDAGPVSAGVFNVDEDGRGLLQLSAASLSQYAAIGVSVEPIGGSEQPTGEIVMLSEL